MRFSFADSRNRGGRTRWFRNDGIADATFMLLSGGGAGEEVRFEPV